MATREWDATTYDSLPLPHVAWGAGVLDRMRLTGHERVLDAGCGTGRDGAALLARWPEARLVGVDGSARMISEARTKLGDVVELHVADLTEPLPLTEPVDAVMSVAAFHWIEDHDRLLSNLAAVMRPGARLTSDCGGQGQLAILGAALVEVTGEGKYGVSYRGVDETRASLAGAGFDVEDVRLRPDPLRIDDREVLDTYLAVVCLGSHLVDLPLEEQRDFVGRVRSAMSEPVIDYVRLEIEAVRR
ncbi:MAG: Methyltransferase domain protein [Nocardioides sp.]|jgi:trans-aconitate 2-methyltransferase|uniref:class I SAM-dependent methyltransferase n=1 Tax=Nocardioides sp. TaxID=35761 RepID=UPI00263000C8|nr:class I SAM-dependent methyltransferase [Nocardioides sp.]MCW2834704.1 Methyltransferase domain protein [Nocardioides sp.]